MGATVQTVIIQHNDGSTSMVSAYFAGSDAAGYIVPVLQGGAAGAGSPTEFKIPAPGFIKYVTGPATGTLQMWVNGQPTNIFLNTAAIITKASDGAARYGNLVGGPQRSYQLRVAVAMAA